MKYQFELQGRFKVKAVSRAKKKAAPFNGGFPSKGESNN